MAELLKLREADDPRDLIHRAVHRLVEGELVSLPCETSQVIVANGLRPDAVVRLQSLANSWGHEARSSNDSGLCLAVKGPDEVKDYVLEFSKTAFRLMHRLWPGPLVLALPLPTQHGLFRELPPETQLALQQKLSLEQSEVWFRMAAHQVVMSAQSLLPGPLVIWEPGFSSPMEVLKQLGTDQVGLLIQDEPGRHRGKPTVVRIEDHSWKILEPGIVTESQLHRMTGKVILFVCTGNTCRSPLAEGLCRKFLADRLRCSPEELPERGYTILSAGLAAMPGAPAAPESVQVAREYGADLELHSSQPLTDDLLAQADYVFTMTQSHKDSILFARPDAADRVSLLSIEEADIPDPIGGGPREYEACGGEIARHLEAILNQLEPRT